MENYILGRDGTMHIAHHGRKGMKWYQHIFGALDPRAEYKVGRMKNDGTRTYGTKNIKNATDDELRQQINRKNLESEYLSKVNPRHEGVCRKILSKVGSKLIDKAAGEITDRATTFVKNAIDGTQGSVKRKVRREMMMEERKQQARREIEEERRLRLGGG